MKLSHAAAIIAFSAQSLSSPAVVMAGSGKTGKKSKALAKTNAANSSYSSSMSMASRPTDAPTTAPPNCRDDLYAFKFDEEERTFSDGGNTVRTFIPLYGEGPCPDSPDSTVTCPDFSTVVGEYNSVDFIIPAGVGFGAGTGFTCQQQVMIGLNLVGTAPAFYEDQLSGSGICFSQGPGTGTFSALEGSSAATGGTGIYDGASGRIDYQCYSVTECTIRVRVCVSREHLL